MQYETTGEDVYRVQPSGSVSRVAYRGTESLTITQEGSSRRFEARAHYLRDAPGERSNADASFVQVMRADGSFEDRIDDDPDFLTILNQPFAVELDPATLRDLRELRGRVPFDAASPLGGETMLRGFLRPGRADRFKGARRSQCALKRRGR